MILATNSNSKLNSSCQAYMQNFCIIACSFFNPLFFWIAVNHNGQKSLLHSATSTVVNIETDTKKRGLKYRLGNWPIMFMSKAVNSVRTQSFSTQFTPLEYKKSGKMAFKGREKSIAKNQSMQSWPDIWTSSTISRKKGPKGKQLLSLATIDNLVNILHIL